MTISLCDLREWLCKQYDGYSVESTPVKGTYGLIWFLNANEPNTYPNTFAVKTVDLDKINNAPDSDDIVNLHREFRIWLSLPGTYNVLPALGFNMATFVDIKTNRTMYLPLMRMPRMAGSLETWVNTPSGKETPDRLIALAQALNGLQYLYDHGIEGHGDLKPSNLLYDDLREKFTPNNSKTWPSAVHPWRIRVADLGWADAWVDLGFSTKAFREYMAPERFDGTFVPIKSDTFSMGIIAAELLQGHHPADNLKARKKSEGAWKRWVSRGDRNLSGVSSARLKAVIEQCLCEKPEARPNALEFQSEICAELKESFGLDILETLHLWRSSAGGNDTAFENDYFAWASKQSACLSPKESKASRMHLSEKLQKIDVVDFNSCEEWAPLAESFVHLTTEDDHERRQICILAKEYLVTIIGALDRNEITQLGARSDWPTLRPFERYAMLAEYLFEIAEIDKDNGAEIIEQIGSAAKSLFYYLSASKFHLLGKLQDAIEGISSAIDQFPNEPTYYYFRALWKCQHLWTHQGLGPKSDMQVIPEIAEIVCDLEKAIIFEPNWEEPKRLLNKVRP